MENQILDFTVSVGRMPPHLLLAPSRIQERPTSELSGNPITDIDMLLDSAGKTFGRYQVQERLGKGGMGEVYKALDTQLNRFVALKILLDKYIEDESCVKRFEQEARAVSGLNHPHILTVYDIGSLGEGGTFIAT